MAAVFLDKMAPWLVACGIAAFYFLKRATLSLPFFWDEPVVYALPARVVFREGFLKIHPYFDRARELFYGHPPAYASSISAFYHLFGESQWTARFFSFCLASIGLFATYRLLRLRFGAWAGFVGMALLASTPSYFVQSTQVLSDVAVMCLIPVLLYLAASDKMRLYALVAIYTILTKETALAPVVAIPLARLLSQGRLTRREVLCYSSPVIALALFFVDEKVFTGHFSNWPPGTGNIVQNFSTYAANLTAQFNQAIVAQPGRSFFLSTSVFSLLGWAIIGRWPFSAEGPGWIYLGALLTIVFWLLGNALLLDGNPQYFIPLAPPHYFIPLEPPLVICAVALSWNLLLAPWASAPMLALCLILWVQVPDYYFSNHAAVGDPQEAKMNYVDTILLQQEALRYVRSSYQGCKVNAVWPLSTAMEMNLDDGADFNVSIVDSPEEVNFDILVLAEASARDLFQRQKKVVKSEKLILDRVFERGGRKISVFLHPRSNAGEGGCGSH